MYFHGYQPPIPKVRVRDWPVTVGVVEVGVVDTRYGISQPGADAEVTGARVYTASLAGRGDGYQCGLDWECSSGISNSAVSGDLE